MDAVIATLRDALIAVLLALAVWLMEFGEPAPSPPRAPGEKYTHKFNVDRGFVGDDRELAADMARMFSRN